MFKEIVTMIQKMMSDKYYSKENILDARCEFRLNEKEKILLESFCKLRGINKSTLIRSLLKKEIDTFINYSYKDIPYMK